MNCNQIGLVEGVLLIFLVVAPTLAVIFKRDRGAAILAVVAVVALLLTRLPSISSIELFGLKAKLEAQTQQVEVTLQQLQKMALASARANLNQLAVSGRILLVINPKEKFLVHDQIIDSLRGIGLSNEDISSTQDGWIGVNCDILLSEFKQQVKTLLPDAKTDEEISGLPHDKNRDLPTPETLRNWTDAKKLNDDKLNRLLNIYTSIWTTGTVKSPDLIPN